jgi:hypothetical protein
MAEAEDQSDRYDLLMLRLRRMDARLRDVAEEVRDIGARLILIEGDVATGSSHRVRHEGNLAEIRVKLERVERQSELRDGRD